MSRLTRQAIAGAAQPIEAGEVSPRELLAAMLGKSRDQVEADASFYDRYIKDARRPRRGSPLTDSNLRQVADIYRAALDRGDPPTEVVTAALQVSRSTAGRWVAKARERGFLGSAIPGRAGERTMGS